jgi:polyhydroxyalkanoate synthase
MDTLPHITPTLREARNPLGALPLQCSLTIWHLLLANNALPLVSSALQNSNPSFTNSSISSMPPPLRQAWAQALAHPELSNALQNESLARINTLLQGVLTYACDEKSTEPVDSISPHLPQTCWKKLSARLLDYGAPDEDAPPLLVIPSLINRYYILDLSPKRSFIGFLKEQGYHPYILDWGTPESEMAHFSSNHYFRELLAPALEMISKRHRRKIHLAGYCIGGLFALAAAQHYASKTASLALLATPWDFHARDVDPLLLGAEDIQTLEAMINQYHILPPLMLQMLFFTLNPSLFVERFQQLARLQRHSARLRECIEVERWANDGVPITTPIAREAFIDWSARNILARKEWKIAGETIVPAKISVPAFAALPQNDRIVPPGCARALTEELPDCTLTVPDSGHVSMMVGNRARKHLWQPYGQWLSML